MNLLIYSILPRNPLLSFLFGSMRQRGSSSCR